MIYEFKEELYLIFRRLQGPLRILLKIKYNSLNSLL